MLLLQSGPSMDAPQMVLLQTSANVARVTVETGKSMVSVADLVRDSNSGRLLGRIGHLRCCVVMSFPLGIPLLLCCVA